MSIPLIKSEEIDDYANKPISINFKINYISYSGIRVKFIKINEEYKSSSWVKYSLSSGNYYFRTKYV
jgi:hypothetical protein